MEENKIYIGNLDYSITDAEMGNILTERGITFKDIRIIKDKYTGRSKGFGFAEFDSNEEARKAIDALNGQEVKGRTLKVSPALKKEQRFHKRRLHRREF